MKIKYITDSPNQTKKLGKILAQELLRGRLTEKVYPVGSRRDSYGAFILGLEGDLGGGKTTFLQGFAKGLGIKEKILSPTFIIMKKFEIQSASRRTKFEYFFHIDCYRIKKAKEILGLGFKEIISNPQNIVAVEWAERIKKILPKDILILKFEFINPVRNLKKRKRAGKKQISNGVNKIKRKILINPYTNRILRSTQIK